MHELLKAWRNYVLSNFRFRNLSVSVIDILKITIVLCWLVWMMSYSLIASINIPTFHIDGAFQTASGLYRLDAGQFPGKDFYPYLGIGPLFVLYPFFKVFGANISASVFSAQLVVLLVGVLSTALIWHLVWRSKSFLLSLTVGSFLFLAPKGITNFFSLSLPDWMILDFSPGASLRPIRSVAPYLVVIFYYFFIYYKNVTWKKYALSGLLTGLILLWSNDFAIPSAGLFALFICINSLYHNEFRKRNLLIYLLATIFSWVIFLVLVTDIHPFQLLRYNFLDVARDQWWFFGSYDESNRIFNLQQLTKLFSQENYLSLLVLALVTIFALKTKKFEYILLFWIGTVLFAGGVVASIGGHLGGYFGSFYFWGIMTICAGFTRLVWIGFRKIFSYRLQAIIILALILSIVSMSLMVDSLDSLKLSFYNAKNDPNKFFVPELGGYLGNEWKDYINLAKSSKATNVFEEYWGLWSATRKTFSNWPVDSVIHALGDTRETAAKNLHNADIIISTRYLTSPLWQPWNLSQNYWFYENLLRDWTPYALSPTTIIWHKSSESRQLKDVNCRLSNNGSHLLTLQAHNTGFYEVDMQYSFSGNARSLIMVKNNISFGADIGGYISINPSTKRVKFPVYIDKEGSTTFDTKIISQADYNFYIKSCTAEYIPPFNYDNEVLAKPWWVSIDNSFFITDNNWVHGIARNWTGFFVPNADKYLNEYKVGRLVKFVDGENRLITRITSNGFYLRIYLNGEKLKPEKVGWPTEFIVADN